MKQEYDFSKAERVKFYHPDAEYCFPVYLESDMNDFANKLTDEKDIDVQKLVNEWLRADIRLIESVR